MRPCPSTGFARLLVLERVLGALTVLLVAGLGAVHHAFPTDPLWSGLLALLALATIFLATNREVPWTHILLVMALTGVVGGGLLAFATLPLAAAPGTAELCRTSLGWIALFLCARGTVRLAFDQKLKLAQRGWWTIGLTAMVTALGVLLTTSCSESGLAQPAWGIGLAALVLAMANGVIVFPFLLNKRPGPPPSPSHSPAVLFTAFNLGVALLLARESNWAGSAVALALGAGAALILIRARGGRGR